MQITVNASFDRRPVPIVSSLVVMPEVWDNAVWPEYSEPAGSDFATIGRAQYRKSLKPAKSTDYPVERAYLNGGQYLTGGVGNRLAFL